MAPSSPFVLRSGGLLLHINSAEHTANAISAMKSETQKSLAQPQDTVAQPDEPRLLWRIERSGLG